MIVEENICEYFMLLKFVVLCSVASMSSIALTKDLTNEQANHMIKDLGIEDEGLGAEDLTCTISLDYLSDRKYQKKINNLSKRAYNMMRL